MFGLSRKGKWELHFSSFQGKVDEVTVTRCLLLPVMLVHTSFYNL
jgi:hypothetical protein